MEDEYTGLVLPLEGGSHVDASGYRIDQGSLVVSLREGATSGLRRPGALRGFNGFYAASDGFVLTHPMHLLLAIALGAIMLLVLLIWSFVAWFRRPRRTRLHAQT